MKNWKTTLGGVLLALGQLGPDVIPAKYSWATQILSAIGGVLLGVAAKDYNIHSTPEEVSKAGAETKEKP